MIIQTHIDNKFWLRYDKSWVCLNFNEAVKDEDFGYKRRIFKKAL